MKILNTALAAASMLLAAAALAGEAKMSHIQIAIDDGTAGDAIHVDLDSGTMGFNLHEMQEGETRSVVDESGRSILITREADGIKLNVDGKIIDMPLFDSANAVGWVGDVGSIDSDVDVRVIKNKRVMTDANFDGVTIISGKAIDDVTRENIRSSLLSSGHNGEVNFIDKTSSHDGVHKIITIKKDVTAKN